MWIVIAVVSFFILIMLLNIIDSKVHYDIHNVRLMRYSFPDGQYYFAVSFYFWQAKKARVAKQIYSQNTIVEVEGFYYEINHIDGIRPKTGGFFFEKEIRYFGEPLKLERTSNINNYVINQFDQGTIAIDLSTGCSINEYHNIYKYLYENRDIAPLDKEFLLQFLEKLKYRRSTNEEELNSVYNTFLKYEPLASLALNLINTIFSFIK
ncbi:hypothetical protein [Bacillus cabrialesii]|uniref:hypothetical protein n=1 Tax=Bacillus cabrialesii TaxID=2487276 RepID=UPI0028FB0CA8|nr:hypothetical protein [Bacillus cabrialesii]MDU0153242.1 hypothetical protein [Bacillus cabrialesii]